MKKESNDSSTVLNSLPDDVREDLDHCMIDLGFSYDSIENAFVYLKEDKMKLEEALSKFENSTTEVDRKDALDEIVQIIS